MAACIYCCKESPPDESWSPEHIVPQSLGNRRLKLENMVCNTCNHKLGKTVDWDLQRAMEQYDNLKKQIVKGIKGYDTINNIDKYASLDRTTGKHTLHTRQRSGSIKEAVKSKKRDTGFSLNEVPILIGDNMKGVRFSVSVPGVDKDRYKFMTDEMNPFGGRSGAIKIAYEMGYKWFGDKYIEDTFALKLREHLFKCITGVADSPDFAFGYDRWNIASVPRILNSMNREGCEFCFLAQSGCIKRGRRRERGAFIHMVINGRAEYFVKFGEYWNSLFQESISYCYKTGEIAPNGCAWVS